MGNMILEIETGKMYEEENVVNIFCESKEEADKTAEMLKNLGEYRWHDFRKDQNDVPEEGESVFVAVDFKGTEMYMVCEYCEQMFRDGINPPTRFNKDVVAWRYIEPFKKEEDE